MPEHDYRKLLRRTLIAVALCIAAVLVCYFWIDRPPPCVYRPRCDVHQQRRLFASQSASAEIGSKARPPQSILDFQHGVDFPSRRAPRMVKSVAADVLNG